ncbi:PoNi-like cognate immunity protein [Halomonas huangheensis]|uniref:PoNi C-terminal domain-containing protein n=1 Tax=Halomonas huangheensis TaxID=1178482 RepID=W1NBR0_9GAMM|nr:PoNi-like cognate immunity protein [Halomonas huangheensis]ALM52433.1 hypothetical protein AR456_09170 [Halomonas huangheensis]ERL52646.1 hypothetical protein BJB45_18885 [Halomonas huangheensis]
MDHFPQIKRDPLLTSEVFEEQEKFFLNRVLNNKKKEDAIIDSSKDLATRKRISRGQVTDLMEYTILSYSAGKNIDDVKEIFLSCLDSYCQHKTVFPDNLMLYWEQDSYQYYLWFFSLVVMTGQTESLPELIRWYSPAPDGEGEDPLLYALMGRLGILGLSPSTKLEFPKSYGALYEAILGDSSRPKEERQVYVKQYLKSWYQGMEDCYWYGRHKGRFPTFFGYWAFEAGLVTLLYDLDDSSYRDMKYYPKDLVDHARQQGYDKLLDPALMTDQQRHDILLPGAVTPYTARWKSNLLGDEIVLEKGQTLPGPQHSDLNPNHLHFWISFRD